MDKIKAKLVSPEMTSMGGAGCLKEVVDYVSSDEYVGLAGLIEVILPCTTPDIFTMKKSYTVIEAIDETKGKWPSSLGNGWFADSKYLVEDLIDMIVDSGPTHFEENEQGNEFSETLKELGDILKEKNYKGMIDQYAIIVSGKY